VKLLLDECLPIDFRKLIPGHDVFTVAYMGWKGVKNGALLTRAAADDFDGLVTTDAGIGHQQNLATLPVGVVILHAATNDIDDLASMVPALLVALNGLSPRTVVHVR
jgi:hypothetical protein